MESIAIELSPEKLVNPDLDLRYVIPDKIEELTNGKVKDNGYDYGERNSLIIFLKSSNCKEDVQTVIEIIKTEIFLGNNIYKECTISISENDIDFTIVHLIKSEA